MPGKVPISFLLAFTAPAEHRATATLLVADDGQHVESIPDDEILDVPPASSFSLEYFDAMFWDQQSWATEFLDFTSYAPEDVNTVSYPTPQSRADAVLDDRLAQLRQQLASAHTSLSAKDPTLGAHFDQRLAEQVFTARNLERSVQTYFRLLNPFYPFIHRPSFDCETVSLYLLLAIFLFGCLALPSTELNSFARTVFDIAEEHIFDAPTLQHLHDGTTSYEDVEVLQAALVIEIIQNGTNDPAWQVFVREETRVRLATWALIMDSCFAIMFNSCPLITISEIQTDFPCREDVFEAESEAAFNTLMPCRIPEVRHKPAQTFKDILTDYWTPEAYENVDATGLGVVICALQSRTMTARHWSLLPATQTITLRAADRWERLWHSLTDRDDSKGPPLKGFTKNNEELCSFVRMLVRAGDVEVPSCRYTTIQPTDDIGHLNQFLKTFGTV
ncbi:hypothetical protein TI39_contig4389g00005 [Zymoseptoria brevis]|uniref:Xylanolytic transcriptional activator regulatory domain-containing protein n=1 Tax=Zymoseptoria brevis TaxID=1047168 RepID=A0A0F4G6Y5_9PEZI|nr:hypothetical protein TI39_contig4389g00005 [Zymoseptoria brevis]